MHEFSGLVDSCAKFSIATLGELERRTFDALSESGATAHVKSLQMAQLQRAILAVGMFSLFEANLQDALDESGFEAARRILNEQKEYDVRERFDTFCLAINTLKHGRGRSYEALLARADSLPFKVKLEDEAFFNEGNVSEVRTLVQVNDDFLQRCANVIAEVAEIIKRATRAMI